MAKPRLKTRRVARFPVCNRSGPAGLLTVGRSEAWLLRSSEVSAASSAHSKAPRKESAGLVSPLVRQFDAICGSALR